MADNIILSLVKCLLLLRDRPGDDDMNNPSSSTTPYTDTDTDTDTTITTDTTVLLAEDSRRWRSHYHHRNHLLFYFFDSAPTQEQLEWRHWRDRCRRKKNKKKKYPIHLRQ